jgi:drug/metabolite transporter (DMT)-like permease
MVAASVCWSFGGLFIKLIPWGAMSIIGIRAALAAGVFAALRRGFKIEFTRGNILAALSLSLTTVLFVFANKLTTAAAAILLQFSAPVFIIVMQFLLYRRRVRPSEAIAVSATVAGMLLFFAESLGEGGFLGNILAIGSGISFAGVFVCNQMPDAKPEQSAMLAFYSNAAIGLPFAFFEVTADFTAWSCVVFLGVVQVGLAYVFFSWGVKTTPALLACLITALEPVLNPLWVWIAIGEAPGGFAVLGGAVIVASVVGYNIWVEKNPVKAPTPEQSQV